MRNWSEFDAIYTQLFGSVYPQPEDDGHTELARRAIEWMVSKINFTTVLDLGCGTGFCQPLLEAQGKSYAGVAWGEDVRTARGMGRNVFQKDFNFLNFRYTFDAGIARHSLEHSPFPIMTLCHWRRFISNHLLVVMPAAEWYMYRGQNHFNVMPELQAENVFEQSGWEVEHKKIEYRWGLPYMDAPLAETKYEYWYIVKKI